ncbi:MAG: hypothetical protein AB7R69_04710 [Candidatus Babeliales bacterium]
MNKQLKKIIYLAALLCINQLGAHPFATLHDCKAYHLVTFTPCKSASGKKITLNRMIKTMRKNKRWTLEGTYIQTKPNKFLQLSTYLPQNYMGTLYVNMPGYITPRNKYNYPDRCAAEMVLAYQKGFIENCLAVSFCPPNHDRSQFNFGQEDDQKLLSKFLNTLAGQNPQASIIINGTCAGATGVLNTLTRTDLLTPLAQKNIKAALLQSPGITSDRVLKDRVKPFFNYVPFLKPAFQAAIHHVALPNCKPENEQEVLARYNTIPKHIEFLIAKLAHDRVTPSKTIARQEEILKKNNIKITVFESHNKSIKHAYLARDADFLATVKTFLAERNLDH